MSAEKNTKKSTRGQLEPATDVVHAWLCLPKPSNDPSRPPLTCQQEHLTSDDPAIRCNGVKKGSFPKASRAPNFVFKDRMRRHGGGTII